MPSWANFIYILRTGRGARAQPTLNVQLSALQAGVVFAGRYLLCLRDFFAGVVMERRGLCYLGARAGARLYVRTDFCC